MTQTRPHPAALLSRTFGRGAPIPSTRPWSGRRWSTSLDGATVRRAIALYRRLLGGDLSALREVSRSESDTTPALIVMLIGVLGASLGGWLWMTLDGASASLGQSALRVLLLGSLASVAAWCCWLGVAWYSLRSIFQVTVELRGLMRPLALASGFAIWQFFMLAGPASFAVGLIATVAGVLLAVIAVRAAAPEANDRAAVISAGIGFGVYALALSLLADLTGVGSGIFVHAIG